MWFHDVKRLRSHCECVVATCGMSMVIAQSSRFAKWLDVVIKQGNEFLLPNVLDAVGDLLYPLLQSSIIHLHR
jgi:hypothetical protein